MTIQPVENSDLNENIEIHKKHCFIDLEVVKQQLGPFVTIIFT